jgi:hypothetical protein
MNYVNLNSLIAYLGKLQIRLSCRADVVDLAKLKTMEAGIPFRWTGLIY